MSRWGGTEGETTERWVDRETRRWGDKRGRMRTDRWETGRQTGEEKGGEKRWGM